MSAFAAKDGSYATTSLIASGCVIDDRKRLGRPLCHRYALSSLGVARASAH